MKRKLIRSFENVCSFDNFLINSDNSYLSVVNLYNPLGEYIAKQGRHHYHQPHLLAVTITKPYLTPGKPTTTPRFKIPTLCTAIRRMEKHHHHNQSSEDIINKLLTRLITMRSKPDYVEFVLLYLLLMLLWFLLL